MPNTKFGPTIIALSLLQTLNLYILSKSNPNIITNNPFLSLSQISALFSTILLAWVFLLSSRLPIIENLFLNYSQMIKLHINLGVIAFILLIQHPLFLILNYFNIPYRYLSFTLPSQNPAYNYGIIGFYFLFLLILTSLFLNLPLKIKSFAHILLSLGIIPAFIHIFIIPSDISRYLPLRYWTLGFLITGTFTLMYTKLLSNLFIKKTKLKPNFDHIHISNHIPNQIYQDQVHYPSLQSKDNSLLN